MFKLLIAASCLAMASARPGLIAPAPLAAPLAYAAPAHLTYAAPAHVSYAAHAPVVTYAAAPAPVAAAIPAPVAYSTGVEVRYHAEPVEQHGYKIVY